MGRRIYILVLLPIVMTALSLGSVAGSVEAAGASSSVVSHAARATLMSTRPTSPAMSVVVVSPTSAPIGPIGATVTVRLVGADGHAEQGKEVMVVPMNGDPVVKMDSDPTDGNGQATFTVTDTNLQTVYFAVGDLSDGLSIPRNPCVHFVSGLPAVTPEAPVALALPVMAAGLLGGTALVSRARRRSKTKA